MKIVNLLFGVQLVSAAISSNSRLVHRDVVTSTVTRLPHVLDKRDAYTCYGVRTRLLGHPIYNVRYS